MGEPPHILLVDDEDTFRNATVELLRLEGYSCTGADSGGSAMALCRETTYDVVVADINMPGNKGLEFVRALAEQRADVPVVLITGYPTLDTAIQSVRLPILDYLVKPVGFSDLLGVLRRILKQTEARQSIRRMRERLEVWSNELDAVIEAEGKAGQQLASAHLETFADLTYKNIVEAVADTKRLTRAMVQEKRMDEVCRSLQCQPLKQYEEAIQETIEVLRNTKGSFKSKELANLRRKLEELGN